MGTWVDAGRSFTRGKNKGPGTVTMALDICECVGVVALQRNMASSRCDAGSMYARDAR